MSIRPVDMQVMVQRMPEVNRLTNNDGSRAETQNNAFAQQFARLADERQKTVNQSEEVGKQQLEKDGRGGGSPQDRHKAEREAEEQADEKKASVPGRGMLDITI